MYVITLANPKGGTGKTTTAMIIAEQLALANARVTFLDLDPAKNAIIWRDMREDRKAKQPFKILERPETSKLVREIEALEGTTDYLIIDLEGTKDQIATFALSRTDLCLVPTDGSAIEARQAATAIGLVEQTAEMMRQPIQCAVVFARANAAFQTKDEKDVRASLIENEIPVISERIVARAAYRRIFKDAMTVGEIAAETPDDDASQGAKAMVNAQRFTQAIIDFVKENQA